MAKSSTSKTVAGVVGLYGIVAIAGAVAATLKPEFGTAGLLTMAMAITLAPVSVLLVLRGQSEEALRAQEERLARAIENMNREAGISEAAKRVLHRRHDRDTLCRAIEQDIQDRDWDAAMILVKELAERFGYRADAEAFRTRIERARAETLDREVTEALSNFKTMVQTHRWTDAYAEAARLNRLFPESARVDGLQERIDEAKRQHKLELERRFLEAARREDTETALNLLKDLDHYLAGDEAEQFKEVARGVIGKARDNLGVSFKLLVQDKSWAEAVAVGERIIAQFPNTRMAQEVRDILDTLRQRAAAARTGIGMQ